jgi:hypothetical protein
VTPKFTVNDFTATTPTPKFVIKRLPSAASPKTEHGNSFPTTPTSSANARYRTVCRGRLIASALRSALLTESHCSRSVIVILTVAGPREGRWWMITIPDSAELRGL